MSTQCSHGLIILNIHWWRSFHFSGIIIDELVVCFNKIVCRELGRRELVHYLGYCFISINRFSIGPYTKLVNKTLEFLLYSIEILMEQKV